MKRGLRKAKAVGVNRRPHLSSPSPTELFLLRDMLTDVPMERLFVRRFVFSRDGGLNIFLGPVCGPGLLSRSGATQFFVDRIKAADEFGIFRYRMGSSNQVALHLVARFSG